MIGDKMQIGNITINKYKCQWKHSGLHRYIKKTAILHSDSLQNVKIKAAKFYGSLPTEIVLIGG